MKVLLPFGQTDSSSQVAASWAYVDTCSGWPKGFASFQSLVRASWKKSHFQAGISCVSVLMIGHLALTELGCQTMNKLRRLACKYDVDQSECKSSQLNVDPLKAWPNGVARRPKFQLSCVSVFASLFGQGFKAMDDAAGWFEFNSQILLITFVSFCCILGMVMLQLVTASIGTFVA